MELGCINCLRETHNLVHTLPPPSSSLPPFLPSSIPPSLHPFLPPACDCLPNGSDIGLCDSTTGQCSCLPGVSGERCEQCMVGYICHTVGYISTWTTLLRTCGGGGSWELSGGDLINHSSKKACLISLTHTHTHTHTQNNHTQSLGSGTSLRGWGVSRVTAVAGALAMSVTWTQGCVCAQWEWVGPTAAPVCPDSSTSLPMAAQVSTPSYKCLVCVSVSVCVGEYN